MQIVSADHRDNLANLIRLGLTLVLLEVQELPHIRTRKDAMTAAAADLLKSEGHDQPHQILEVDVADATTKDALEESGRLHVGESNEGM